MSIYACFKHFMDSVQFIRIWLLWKIVIESKQTMCSNCITFFTIQATFTACPSACAIVSILTFLRLGKTEVCTCLIISWDIFKVSIHQRTFDDLKDARINNKPTNRILRCRFFLQATFSYKALEYIALFLPILASHFFKISVFKPTTNFAKNWATTHRTPHFVARNVNSNFFTVGLSDHSVKIQTDHLTFTPKVSVACITIWEEAHYTSCIFGDVPERINCVIAA